ncbi:MAG: hypothetical protein KatS3mg131_0065 [Candidatus Tectimicrobiota bacterium]|nr:MAG: hypothetical protein KatS3mg131_0065 [Candidatus Tectomicrobia bacterium]
MLNTTYEPFAHEAVYVELNRQFLQRLLPHLPPVRCLVDVACGTGTLSSLLLSALPQPAGAQGALRLIGVDLSRVSLTLARRHLTPHAAFPPMQVALLEASGDRLPVADAVADVVLLGNAIHCFADKNALFGEVHRVLRKAGLFAFNSAFYAGTLVPGTENFYEIWMKEALRYLQQRAGGARPARRRGAAQPAFANRWFTPAEYQQALEACGFEMVSLGERCVGLSRHHFETVGAYADLASVLLRGYPVALACEALHQAVGPAFAQAGVQEIPRAWLEVVARKR